MKCERVLHFWLELFSSEFLRRRVFVEKTAVYVDFIVRSVKLAMREFPFVLCWPSAKSPADVEAKTDLYRFLSDICIYRSAPARSNSV